MIEFDPEKDRSNRAKHGLSLAMGERVIGDPNALRLPDETMDYGEERWIAIGLVQGTVHIAVYTVRAGRVRMISVRQATRSETDHYYRNRGFGGE